MCRCPGGCQQLLDFLGSSMVRLWPQELKPLELTSASNPQGGHLPRAIMERGVDKDLGEVSTVPMKDFVAITDGKE